MNFLSIFVLIPLLMLPALWLSRSLNQVRGVMVAGSTALLAAAVYLVYFICRFANSEFNYCWIF